MTDKVKSLCVTLMTMRHHTAPLAGEAFNQHDELLAYVKKLEDGIIEHKLGYLMYGGPKWLWELQRDAVKRCENEGGE